MFKSDVINFYGTKAKVAKAAGVDPSAVSQWQELVPEGRAMRLARQAIKIWDHLWLQYTSGRTLNHTLRCIVIS